MQIKQDHYLGEYDAEIGRRSLFQSKTEIYGLSTEYEVESIEITIRRKDDGETFTLYSESIA